MKAFACFCGFFALSAAAAIHTPDLAALGRGGAGWEIAARPAFEPVRDPAPHQAAVQNNPVSIAYVAGLELAEGEIEFDARGRVGDGSSFVGVAFHGVDGATFEAVYFRSFNFGHSDPVKRRHAVQYIAHPDWPWFRLRRERTDEFEKAVTPEPAPADWFHVRVVLGAGRVKVFVNGATEPSLDVPRLSERAAGKVGVWMGGYGDIANLKITTRS